MFGLVRKVCSLLVGVCLYIVELFRGKRAGSGVDGRPGGKQEQWDESGWGADGWEEFTVKVVPSEGESGDTQQAEEGGEQDFFKDMAPVFRKAKKIAIHQGNRDDSHVNMDKFAVQNSFQQEECVQVGELGVWSEEGEGKGDAWEEGLLPVDEGELVLDSVREKRRQEREKRRAHQELLRKQQRQSGHQHLQLGTKVS